MLIACWVQAMTSRLLAVAQELVSSRQRVQGGGGGGLAETAAKPTPRSNEAPKVVRVWRQIGGETEKCL